MILDTDEALKVHIEGLQATITKRNARIAELEEKLKLPVPLEPEIERRIKKAYKEGWKDCAKTLMESTREAVHALSTIRKDAFALYLQEETQL